jgi:hypothetical protein
MPFCRACRQTRRFGIHWDKSAAREAILRHAVVRVTACEAGCFTHASHRLQVTPSELRASQ